MPAVTEEKIYAVASTLAHGLYEETFRGKDRGRFCVTREQLKTALDVKRLHPSTIQSLQDEALSLGLVIIDLDDLFPCIEVLVTRKYRRPPADIFLKFFPKKNEDITSEFDDDE